ncbi:MAG: stage V sporulation protein AD [Lachnospiraceae bacterium]|nr:stage V sporulation protein AD [Lachnospiraceae bacterium]
MLYGDNAYFAIGQQSVLVPVPVFVRGSASIVGSKEGKGPMGELFDVVSEDDYIGCDSWEAAESCLQRQAVSMTLEKTSMTPKEIRYLFAGDLLSQSMASSFGLQDFNIPLFGVYGACSTCGESLTLGTMAVCGGFAGNVMCVISSHFASAEKEFRYPLSYGNQRPLSAAWTVTGSAAFILSSEKTDNDLALVTSFTTGKIVDYGLKDSFNMGCCMAPAAADTIFRNLKDFQRHPCDYDKIITGDLGKVGKTVLLDLLNEKGLDITEQYMDCGMEIYDPNTQDCHAGGSGCGCAAVVLSAYVLKQLASGNWHRVLFVPTGALLSKTSYNEGNTVPGIAHAIVLERINR